MYLTEESLGVILRSIPGATVEGQWKLPNTRYRYDYKVTTPQSVFYVEFDGSYHFTCPNTVSRDVRKDGLLQDCVTSMEYVLEYGEDSNEETDPGFYDYVANKHRVIRIPYFIQLDILMLEFYFPGISITAEYTYPHGFIDKKAKTPDNFCYTGILRYLDILDTIPAKVAEAIKASAIGNTAFSISCRVCFAEADTVEHYFDVSGAIILYTKHKPQVPQGVTCVKLPDNFTIKHTVNVIKSYIYYNDKEDYYRLRELLDYSINNPNLAFIRSIL